jgi:hypothetical protein
VLNAHLFESVAELTGRFKARFFAQLGYRSDNWRRLADDLRKQHVSQDAQALGPNEYGIKYQIKAPLKGPLGSPALVVSIWFIPKAESVPRFVTAYKGHEDDL